MPSQIDWDRARETLKAKTGISGNLDIAVMPSNPGVYKVKNKEGCYFVKDSEGLSHSFSVPQEGISTYLELIEKGLYPPYTFIDGMQSPHGGYRVILFVPSLWVPSDSELEMLSSKAKKPSELDRRLARLLESHQISFPEKFSAQWERLVNCSERILDRQGFSPDRDLYELCNYGIDSTTGRVYYHDLHLIDRFSPSIK